MTAAHNDGPLIWFPTAAEQRAKMALDDAFAAANAQFRQLLERNAAIAAGLAREAVQVLAAGNTFGAKRRFVEGLALMDEVEVAYLVVRDAQRAIHAYGERGGIVDFLYAG